MPLLPFKHCVAACILDSFQACNIQDVMFTHNMKKTCLVRCLCMGIKNYIGILLSKTTLHFVISFMFTVTPFIAVQEVLVMFACMSFCL